MIALGLLQVAAVVGPVPPIVLARRPCPAAGSSDEVVVCGRPGDQGQRLRPLPPYRSGATRDPLGFRLPGGGTGNVHPFRKDLPSASGQGIAVSLRLPFGRGARPDRGP